MKLIPILALSAILAALGFGIGSSLSEWSKRADPNLQTTHKTNPAVAAEAPVAPPIPTLDEVESRASHFALNTYLASQDSAGLCEFIDRLSAIDPRNPWQSTMHQQAFYVLSEMDPAAALARLETVFSQGQHQKEIKRLFAALAQRDLALARELHASLEEKFRAAAESEIAVAWLAQDREAAMAWLLEVRGQERFDKGWRELLKKWARHDPRAAMRELDARDDEKKGELKRVVIGGWLQDDPDAAIAWMEADAGDDQKKWDAYWISGFGSDAIKAASFQLFDLIGRHPPSNDHGLLGSLTFWMVDVDPEKALACYQQAGEETQQQMIESLASGFAETDPARAAALIDTAGPDTFRINGVNKILDHFLIKDPAAAAAWWQSLPHQDRAHLHLNNIREPDDFVQAAAFASELDHPTEHLHLFESLAKRWAQVDAGAAMDWARTLPEGSLRNASMARAFEKLAESDPIAALEIAESTTDLGLRGKMMTTAASEWVASSPAEALLHISQLGGASGVRALDAALERAVNDDPATVAELIATQPEQFSAIDQVQVSSDIARRWASRDLDAATRWAQSLPEGPRRDAGLAGTASTIAKHDPAAARQILDQLPASDSRDAALEIGSHDLSRIDPAAAFDWALDITDPELQLSRLGPAIRHWARIDPDAADAALENPNFDTETRTELLREISR